MITTTRYDEQIRCTKDDGTLIGWVWLDGSGKYAVEIISRGYTTKEEALARMVEFE